MDVVSRRLELLKLEGRGFSQAEIVKELSQKLGCSERTVSIVIGKITNRDSLIIAASCTNNLLIQCHSKPKKTYEITFYFHVTRMQPRSPH